MRHRLRSGAAPGRGKAGAHRDAPGGGIRSRRRTPPAADPACARGRPDDARRAAPLGRGTPDPEPGPSAECRPRLRARPRARGGCGVAAHEVPIARAGIPSVRVAPRAHAQPSWCVGRRGRLLGADGRPQHGDGVRRGGPPAPRSHRHARRGPPPPRRAPRRPPPRRPRILPADGHTGSRRAGLHRAGRFVRRAGDDRERHHGAPFLAGREPGRCEDPAGRRRTRAAGRGRGRRGRRAVRLARIARAPADALFPAAVHRAARHDRAAPHRRRARRPLPDPNARPDADHRTVVPGYFHLMAIPVLAGRDFTERDDSSAAPVTIVSATTARRFWPGENPVGARIRLGDVVRGPLVEVVGVVGDVRYGSLESPEPRPMLYFPLRYTGQRVMTVLLRTAGEPAALTAAVRRELLALDPVQPVSAVRTLDEVVSTTMSPRRFNVVVLGVFAGTALLLAGIGLYGVMAYAVTQRTREIGVRLALGAEGRGVVAMVLRDSFRLVAAGVALGLAGALVLDRALASLLFQVGPHDPPSLLAASVALVLVALLGSYLPARRAARVDPLTALRAE